MYQQIAITNRLLCKTDFLDKIQEICDLKVDRIILREKDLRSEDYAQLVESVFRITESNQVPLVLHSFYEVAHAMEMKRVHFTMDLFLEYVEKYQDFSAFEEVGVSIHSLEEGLIAEKLGASYVIFGHIFPTMCKENVPPRGLLQLKELCKTLQLPVYALGGITEENMPSVLESGALGICQMSQYMR